MKLSNKNIVSGLLSSAAMLTIALSANAASTTTAPKAPASKMASTTTTAPKSTAKKPATKMAKKPHKHVMKATTKMTTKTATKTPAKG